MPRVSVKKPTAKKEEANPVEENNKIQEVDENVDEPIIEIEEAEEPIEYVDATIVDSAHIEEQSESDEISFLRLLLHKQHDGGWGHHLDDIIYNRIAELKK